MAALAYRGDAHSRLLLPPRRVLHSIHRETEILNCLTDQSRILGFQPVARRIVRYGHQQCSPVDALKLSALKPIVITLCADLALQVLTNLIPVIHEFRHTTSLGFPQRFHNVVGSMDDDLKNSRRRLLSVSPW